MCLFGTEPTGYVFVGGQDHVMWCTNFQPLDELVYVNAVLLDSRGSRTSWAICCWGEHRTGHLRLQTVQQPSQVNVASIK